MADMRGRICIGMKRYFYSKNVEGLLSNAVRRPESLLSILQPALSRKLSIGFTAYDTEQDPVSSACAQLLLLQPTVFLFALLASLISSCYLSIDRVSQSSAQALRILQHSCDSEIDSPDTPLALWEDLEKDIRGGVFGNIRVLARPSTCGTPMRLTFSKPRACV